MFQDGLDQNSFSDQGAGEISPAFQALTERGQALAATLSAKRFSLILVSHRDGGTTILPFIDTSYPGLSSLSRVLTAPGGIDERADAARRAAPTIFGLPPQDAPSGAYSHETTLVPGEIAIVFPVHSSCGRRGLVAVSGTAPRLDDDALTRAHLRAFALFRSACALRTPEPAARTNLTKRDIECLRLTADGLTSEQLAERLGLSVHTANQYVSAVVEKLDAVNRMHAVAKALRAGIAYEIIPAKVRSGFASGIAQNMKPFILP
jgi:DNA-binding CsgD family transcriptional regulator